MKDFEMIKSDKRIMVEKICEDGCAGHLFLSTGKQACFVFSFGGGWEHLSVSMPRNLPTWDDMCAAKDLFFEKEECCVQYHPAESDYVNIHPYCLHIWRPISEKIPTPPKEFV